MKVLDRRLLLAACHRWELEARRCDEIASASADKRSREQSAVRASAYRDCVFGVISLISEHQMECAA